MSPRRRSSNVTTNDYTIDVALVERLMSEKDWTWADLAVQMGVSKSSVSRVTRYESKPSAAFIFALMRIFPQHSRVMFVPYNNPVDERLTS